MRPLIGTVAVLLLLAGIGLGSKKPETLEELKARAEAASGEDKPVLYAEVVLQEIEAADQLFTDGATDQAHAMVKESVGYAEKARDACKELRPKKMKKTEIALRQAENRMNALRRTLALEDQQNVQEAADSIGKIRGEILSLMFAPKRK